MKLRILFVLLLTFSLTGCATVSRDRSMINQLQMRIGELERELDMKDQQIADLGYNVKDLSYAVDRLKAEKKKTQTITTTRRRVRETVSEAATSDTKEGIIRVQASPEDIQAALRNAGYYSADVDGKIGNKTKTAIASFQKDNGLTADGIVGQQTWGQLKIFLE